MPVETKMLAAYHGLLKGRGCRPIDMRSTELYSDGSRRARASPPRLSSLDPKVGVQTSLTRTSLMPGTARMAASTPPGMLPATGQAGVVNVTST
jgi:hypothetical protein